MPDNLAPDQAIVGLDVPDHPISQDEYIVNRLAQQGYDPRDLAAFKHGGGNLAALLPKPQTIEQQDYKDRMRAASLARADKTLNPAARPQPKPKQSVDPITGEITLQQVDPNTNQIKSTPVMSDQFSDVAAYRPKLNAFKGKTDEGAPWTMNRGEFGEATDYSEGATPKPVIKEITRKDGSKINVIQKVNADGSVAYTEAPTTLNGEDYSKPNLPKTKPSSETFNFTDRKLVLNPDTGEYEPKDMPNTAAKKTFSALRESINALTYSKDDPKKTPEELSAIRKTLQRKIESLGKFKDAVIKEHSNGQKVWDQMAGYRDENNNLVLPEDQTQQGQPVPSTPDESVPSASMNPRYRDLNVVSGTGQLPPPQIKSLAPDLSTRHNSILQDFRDGKIDRETTLQMLRDLDKSSTLTQNP